ncbi:cytochrome b/b6 domain-containing protein [Streptomyces uncialis]|uniref:cytochrome b/b6 domain-containing protein n=1 Tax=Streptomyces uncialis TaxID=1048205 RepID=UPI0033C99B7E
MLLIPLLVVIGGEGFRDFVNHGAGVLSLVSLTSSVLWGLVASDRVFLNSRQRLVAQAIHRVTAVAAIAFLLLHISVKIALDHTTVLAALVPFGLGVGGAAGLIGFGSLAALLMVATGLTGALRSAFASPAPVAARWRAVHTLAYPAWCSALVHGLFAGRPAAGWITFLYGMSLVAVIGALGLRAAPAPVRRRVTAQVLAVLGSGPRPGGRAPRDTAEMPLPGVAPPARGRATASRAWDTGPPAPSTALPPRSAEPPTPARVPASPGRPGEPGGGLGMAAAYRAVSTSPPPYPEEPPGAFPDHHRAVPDSYTGSGVPPKARPTGAVPRRGDGVERWPAPSPRPPAEAPPSLYDPLASTPYGSTPTYPTSGHTPTEQLPGPFQAPSSGEPWNAPTGGAN